MTDFEKTIIEKLKDRDLSDNSINTYIKNVKLFNEKKPLKNLNFLKNKDHVKNVLDSYSPNTQKNLLISIIALLKLDEKLRKSKLLSEYQSKLDEMNDQYKEQEQKNEKTEKQKQNWIDYEDMKVKQDELEKSVEKLKKYKTVDSHEYNQILKLLVLSLYLDIPPRRNRDYIDMYIINDPNNAKDENKNYLLINKNKMKFIFNTYKTSKKYGEKEIDIPEHLQDIIKLYLKFYPLDYKKSNKNFEELFLVKSDGKKFLNNSITLILNNIFKKKVSSSMIRHAYLSHHYGDIQQELNEAKNKVLQKHKDEFEKMKEDAKLMAHSKGQAELYIKN